MNHPKTKMNLADVFNGKIANKRPLAVGDELVDAIGKIHAIFATANENTACVVNVTDKRVWGSGPQLISDPDSLTEGEARRLIVSSWDDLSRLSIDGSKTPLADIYAERVEVGVGSYLKWRANDKVYILAKHGTARVCLVCLRSLCGAPYVITDNEVVVASSHNMTADELSKLLGSELCKYDVLPSADALAMLAEMEEGR